MAKLKIGNTIGEHLIATKEDLSNLQDNFSGSYNDLTDKPLTFTPSEHNHNIKDIIGLQDMIDSKVAIYELQEHDSDIATEEGKHGIRYFNEKLSIKSNGEWIDFEVGGGDNGVKLPVGKVENLTIDSADKSTILKWEEPTDFYINGMLMATWQGTKIIRKVGSYPQNENDGVLVVNNGVRNQYAENGFVDTGLTNRVVYYYSIFTYTTDGIFGEKVDMECEVGITIYGVKIDTTNSNSETALTYTDSSIGFVSAKGNNGNFNFGSWEDKFPFNQIKPCLFKNGKVVYYLNPNDFTQKEDGSLADITSYDGGDVMIEFPKIYWNFERVGTDVYVRYSDKKVNDKYKCLAHMKGFEERDKIYIGSYMATAYNGMLRGFSGSANLKKYTLSQFRNLAKANGENYGLITYHQMLMLQVLFVVMFKNLDSQTALGYGYSSSGGNHATGVMNKDGMYCGYDTNYVKFCGIEHLWGNLLVFVDGFYIDSFYNLLIGNENFNDTGDGYINYGKILSGNLEGYMNDIQCVTEYGFLPKTAIGSENTYYADHQRMYSSYILAVGGWNNGYKQNGIFQTYMVSTSQYDDYTTSRLAYC